MEKQLTRIGGHHHCARCHYNLPYARLSVEIPPIHSVNPDDIQAGIITDILRTESLRASKKKKRRWWWCPCLRKKNVIPPDETVCSLVTTGENDIRNSGWRLWSITDEGDYSITEQPSQETISRSFTENVPTVPRLSTHELNDIAREMETYNESRMGYTKRNFGPPLP